MQNSHFILFGLNMTHDMFCSSLKFGSVIPQSILTDVLRLLLKDLYIDKTILIITIYVCIFSAFNEDFSFAGEFPDKSLNYR